MVLCPLAVHRRLDVCNSKELEEDGRRTPGYMISVLSTQRQSHDEKVTQATTIETYRVINLDIPIFSPSEKVFDSRKHMFLEGG